MADFLVDAVQSEAHPLRITERGRRSKCNLNHTLHCRNQWHCLPRGRYSPRCSLKHRVPELITGLSTAGDWRLSVLGFSPLGLRIFTNVGHDLFEVGLTNVGSLISP